MTDPRLPTIYDLTELESPPVLIKLETGEYRLKYGDDFGAVDNARFQRLANELLALIDAARESGTDIDGDDALNAAVEDMYRRQSQIVLEGMTDEDRDALPPGQATKVMAVFFERRQGHLKLAQEGNIPAMPGANRATRRKAAKSKNQTGPS